jgi:hypothetical protein
MTFQIREVDILDDALEQQVVRLQQVAFKTQYKPGKIRLNTYVEKSLQPSFYLGAFEDDLLIGFLGCLAHDMEYNGKPVSAGQMVWGATDPEHRKKRVFSGLAETLKDRMRARGMAFLLGFPNHRSGPILIKQHGFRDSPLVKVQIPSVMGSWRLFLNSPAEDLNAFPDTYWQPDEQLIRLKRQEYGAEIIRVELGKNIIWGRVRNRKLGPLPVRYFDVGGLRLADVSQLPQLLSKLLGQVSVHYLQLVFHHSHPYTALFKNVRPAGGSEPLITFDLNVKTDENTRFALMLGIKDVF